MTMPDLIGAVLDDKFRIERALGSGTGGDVFEATNLALGSRVAVKVLREGHPELADVRRKRFIREARVAARLQSDHVVRVFDVVSRDAGLMYIVMELLQGETLVERVRRDGPMSEKSAVDCILQIIEPLAELHDVGIVHRDIKPSNVFIARSSEGRERMKLLDFGIAALRDFGLAALRQSLLLGAHPASVAPEDSSITHTNAMIGTPRYMAPEQVRDGAKSVDARADVWALGVTLYEILAGSPPFDGEAVLVVLQQIERDEPAPLDARRPGVSPALAALVHRCLAKDPAARPPDARALGAALRALTKAPEAAAERSKDEPAVALSVSGGSARASGARGRGRLAARLGAGLAAGLALGALAVAAMRARTAFPAAPVASSVASSAAPPSASFIASSVAPPVAPSPPADTRSASVAPRGTGEPRAASAAPPAGPVLAAPAPRATAPRVSTKPVPRPAPAKPAPSARWSPENDDRIE